jgi:serine/threonine protein kinase
MSPGEKIGKYQVVATLGSGAHSSILQVRREADGRDYALKLVSIDGEDDKKYLEQARHEYRVGQMLNHPNLIKILAFETESDWLFRVKKVKLLVEYVPGQTLDNAKVLKMARLLRMFEKVAAGLAHMHHKGVYHADLKPNNIMLGRGNQVKVIDYGLAWVKGEAKDRVQGTPEYMAPETASHKLINERTDIFNLAATMYRLVTFQLPPSVMPAGGLAVDEKTYLSLLKPVAELNPTAPKDLCDLIHSCLRFNAHKRPERMSEVQGTLDKLADEAEAKLNPAELEGE